jgi:hypothetical protein
MCQPMVSVIEVRLFEVHGLVTLATASVRRATYPAALFVEAGPARTTIRNLNEDPAGKLTSYPGAVCQFVITGFCR